MKSFTILISIIDLSFAIKYVHCITTERTSSLAQDAATCSSLPAAPTPVLQCLPGNSTVGHPESRTSPKRGCPRRCHPSRPPRYPHRPETRAPSPQTPGCSQSRPYRTLVVVEHSQLKRRMTQLHPTLSHHTHTYSLTQASTHLSGWRPRVCWRCAGHCNGACDRNTRRECSGGARSNPPGPWPRRIGSGMQ